MTKLIRKKNLVCACQRAVDCRELVFGGGVPVRVVLLSEGDARLLVEAANALLSLMWPGDVFEAEDKP